MWGGGGGEGKKNLKHVLTCIKRWGRVKGAKNGEQLVIAKGKVGVGWEEKKKANKGGRRAKTMNRQRGGKKRRKGTSKLGLGEYHERGCVGEIPWSFSQRKKNRKEGKKQRGGGLGGKTTEAFARFFAVVVKKGKHGRRSLKRKRGREHQNTGSNNVREQRRHHWEKGRDGRT